MNEEALWREFERLAARLARLEQHLGLKAEDARSPAPPEREVNGASMPRLTSEAEPSAPVAAAQPTGSPTSTPRDDKVAVFRRLHQGAPPISKPPPLLAPPIRLPPLAPLSAQLSPASPTAAPLVSPPLAPPIRSTAPAAPPRTGAPRQPAPIKPRAPLEVLIGGKWMAWVGAITVVLAAAFAVMVGIDRGWWGQLLPEVRCLMIAAFGAMLILGGELALRRIGKAASVGLFGAGLGTLYLDAFATFQWFGLLTSEGAFALMAIVAIGGFAITWRTRFLTIGILSVVAGYLTPILLFQRAGHDLELLAYLSMLLVISLGLSAIQPRYFRPLRYVALGGQAIIGLSWIFANASQWRMGITFLSTWWVMVVAESVYAAMRRQSSVGNVISVVLTTAAFVTAGCWVLNAPAGTTAGTSAWLGAFTAMIAVLSAAIALQFGPGFDALREPPRIAIDKLSVALWAQAGVLLAVAVALQFDGLGESVGWLAVGVAAIEVGRRLPSRSVAVFGLVVGALAVARVATFDWWQAGMQTTVWQIGEVGITSWAILALGTIVALHVAAHRLRAQPPAAWNVMPRIMIVAATLLWMVLCTTHAEGLTATAGWLVGGAVLLGMQRIGRRQAYFEIAMLLLLATGARWLLVDAALARAGTGWQATESLPLLNWQMGLALAIAAAGWWGYRIMLSREVEAQAAKLSEGQTLGARASAFLNWQRVLILGATFMLIALSFEVDRMVGRLAAPSATLSWPSGQLRQLLLTLLWTFGGTGIGVLAFLMRGRDEGDRVILPRLLVRFAWGLLAACAMKWVAIDTLVWVLDPGRPRAITALPVMNVQMLVGAALAGGAIFLLLTTGTPGRSAARSAEHRRASAAQWIPVAASVLILWGLSFELDRALAMVAAPGNWLAAWPPLQMRALWWTALWALGGLAMIVIGRRFTLPAMIHAGWCIVALGAAAWLSYDTLAWRMLEGPVGVAVVFNLQFAVGILAAALMAIATILLHQPRTQEQIDRQQLTHALQVGLGLIAAIGLWLGSFEIDRFFADQPMMRHTGWSAYWGLYGMALVVLGFLKRAAAARYIGLGLLAITLGKVFIIDMREIDLVWRAVSFAAVGLLLIGTSVVYARLAPRLLGATEPAESRE